ncbi:MFS transporter [Streptomyces sp. NPDC098077]|uniref:MFS transporter n=1 Tax=Streptomyces sp. NPDC098077 TaxID=3366093 RepID=UPI0038002265
MNIAAAKESDSERPAYKDLNVLRWLMAYFCSVTGDTMYFLALSWATVQGVGDAQVGIVLAAGAVPRAVLMLLGGVVADRFGPRRTVIISDSMRCVVILSVAAVLMFTQPTLGLLIFTALVFGTVDALFMPAVGALPPRLAPHSQLGRIQGMRTLVLRLGNTLGPVLAGLALAVSGPAGAFGSAGVLFTVSLVLLFFVRLLPSPERDEEDARETWGHLVDGLRHVRGHTVLTPLVILIALSELCFTGPISVALVLLSKSRGWGESGMGWILSAFSIGGGFSALLLTVRTRIPRAGLVMACSLLIGAAGTAALGQARSLTVAVGLGALVGLAGGVSMVISNTLVQMETDPRYLGRVTALVTLCTLGLTPLMLPLAGAVAAWWNPGGVFLACGVIIAFSACLGLGTGGLRRAALGETAPPGPGASD